MSYAMQCSELLRCFTRMPKNKREASEHSVLRERYTTDYLREYRGLMHYYHRHLHYEYQKVDTSIDQAPQSSSLTSNHRRMQNICNTSKVIEVVLSYYKGQWSKRGQCAAAYMWLRWKFWFLIRSEISNQIKQRGISAFSTIGYKSSSGTLARNLLARSRYAHLIVGQTIVNLFTIFLSVKLQYNIFQWGFTSYILENRVMSCCPVLPPACSSCPPSPVCCLLSAACCVLCAAGTKSTLIFWISTQILYFLPFFMGEFPRNIPQPFPYGSSVPWVIHIAET